MAASIYPPGLPCPATSTVTAGERRLLSERMTQVRGIQRDRTYIETVTFPPMQAAQCAQFDAWWRDDLIEGGAWFAAHWPLPQGLVTGVRRFVGTPQWEFVCLELWRVSATFEVRGETELPMMPADAVPGTGFLDTFTGAAGPLTAHTPDIAPDGFEYFNSAEAPDTDLQLSGSGTAITVPVGYGTSGIANSTASSPPFALEMTLPFTVSMTARASDTLFNSVTLFKLRSEDNSYIDVGLNHPGGYIYPFVELLNNAPGGGYCWATGSYHYPSAEHTIALYVEATQATMYYDGVPGVPMELGGVSMTSFSEVRLLLDSDFPTDTAYISRIEVKPGAP